MDSVFGWTGRYHDSDTGLQWNGSSAGGGRWYDPHIGRWISEDRIEFGGDLSNIGRYAGNSPTNKTDPSGREGIDGAIILDPEVEERLRQRHQQLHGGMPKQCPIQSAGPIPPPIPTDPTQPPGEGWKWSGRPGSRPGDPDGNWIDGNGNKLNPNLNHPDPKGPHWGWKDPYGNNWDWFPDTEKWKGHPDNNPNKPHPQFPPGALILCGAAAGITLAEILEGLGIVLAF